MMGYIRSVISIAMISLTNVNGKLKNNIPCHISVIFGSAEAIASGKCFDIASSDEAYFSIISAVE